MSASDTLFSARPIGTPTGPREDYQPPKIPPYRRSESENQVSHTTSEAAAKEEMQQPGESPLEPTTPTAQNMPYPEQIKAAVQAGHHLTSDIVAATGLTRRVVIRTISYMIRSTGVLQEKPVPAGAAEGDRYVVFTKKVKGSIMSGKTETAKPAATGSTSSVSKERGNDAQETMAEKPPLNSPAPEPMQVSSGVTEADEGRPESARAGGAAVPSMAELYHQAQTYMGKLMETMNEMTRLQEIAAKEVEHYKRLVDGIKKTLG